MPNPKQFKKHKDYLKWYKEYREKNREKLRKYNREYQREYKKLKKVGVEQDSHPNFITNLKQG